MPPPPVPDAAPSAERIPVSVFALNVGLTAATLVITLLGAGSRNRPTAPAWAAVPLLVALIIAGSLRVAYRYGTKIEDLDVFEAVLAPVLLLFDVPAVIALVIVAKVIAEAIARRRFVKAWFNVSQWAVAAGVGAITFGQLDRGTGVNASALAALVAALVAVAVVNHAALVTVMSLAVRTPPLQVLHELQPAVVSGWLVGGALNVTFGLLVAAAAAATPLVTILFVVPLGVLHLASQHLVLEVSRRNLRRATQAANAALSREVDPCDNLEPFLAIVLDAFAAKAVRLVVFSDAGSDVHHIGAPPELVYEYWRSVAADHATSLEKASVLGPGEGDAALLEPGWGQCLAAPVRTEARTIGVLWVIEPQRLSREVDVDLAALTAMAAGLADSFARAEMIHEGFAEHRRSELLLSSEGQVLQSIACGDDLEATLAKIVGFVEAAIPAARCVIAMSPPDRGKSDAGHHPSELVEPPPRFDIVVGDGPAPPISFLAARAKWNEGAPEVRMVSDVHGDARWEPLSDRWQGFQSCWVLPVEDATSDRFVGAVCVAHPEARAVTDTERDSLTVACRLAGLAVARVLSRDQLLYEVRHDRLTGLSNRTAFLDDTNRALARHRRTGHALGVLFLDLDGFKYVNDNMGHDAGDLLLVDVATRLQAVATRLQAIVRTGSSVARYGGDEFTILCEDLVSDNDAFAVAERVATALSRPYVLKGVEAVVTGSIGVALADHHTSAAELIERADAAMYRAKERGRNRIEVFDERTREGSRRRLFEQTVLRQALDARQFVVHYQPLFSLDDMALTGVEALVRWPQRDGTLIEPESFIGLAEDTGLIVPLGSFVLGEACQQAQRWRGNESNSSLGVSVNVSARQIAFGGLVDTVKRALGDSALPAAALTLEITETALMEVTESASVLSELRDLGVMIAIDDFGTGYSSLDYLRRLPFDVIKLDRAFLQELGTDRVTRAIVSSVVNLADTLGLSVVAEGIETEEQLSLVRDLGCSAGQGFYLGRPAASVLALAQSPGLTGA